MKQFMLLFRSTKGSPQPSPEQLEKAIQKWQDWIGGIAAQGKFVSTNQLGFEGKTLLADGTNTDGPYAEVKEMIGGYCIVNADHLEEAVKLAENCPIFDMGGKVEVRNIIQRNG